jgi:hypothetical protein
MEALRVEAFVEAFPKKVARSFGFRLADAAWRGERPHG